MGRQSFLTGALILMIANTVSKILGAVLKIPLTYILNEEGMAVYSTAFEVYIVFLTFVISGFPFAVSRTVSAAFALGDRKKAYKTVRVSVIFLSMVGFFGSVFLYIMAPYLAAAMKEVNAILPIRVIAPSVFFVALGAAYKSYYQGASDMIPVAVSQVIEAFIKLAVGYGLAVCFIEYSIVFSASGAIAGVTAGEILATAILFLGYFRIKKEKIKSDIKTTDILKELFETAIPLLCMSAVANAMGMGETAVIRNRLLCAVSEDEARFLYGAYTGYALTLFHLPTGILSTLGVSLLPVISGAVVSKNMEKAVRVAKAAIKIVMIAALPCAVIMYMMSDTLLEFLFNNSSSQVMLKIIAWAIVPFCVSQIICAILHSAGVILKTFYVNIVFECIRIGLCFYLCAKPEFNIYGVQISFVTVTFLSVFAEYAILKKFMDLKIDIMEIIIKPLIAAGVMVVVIWLLKTPFEEYGLSSMTLLVVLGAISVSVYVGVLFVSGGLKDIRKIFKM